MKKIVLALSLALFPLIGHGTEDALKKSVVKILTIMKQPDWQQPWSMQAQVQTQGSGCILKNHLILTNAHVVSDAVFIQVLKVGDTKKYTARVKYVAHDTECALLEVEDPAFFEGTLPVQFGDVPRQRERVAAYGFPMGGNELSITEGVVSRVEVQTYAHSQSNHLAVQIDAAINPGNSGGPVFQKGKCIGISFQGIRGADNIGYIVPVPVIQRFLKDVADGDYDGTPSLGIYWQKMENKDLKRFYKVPEKNTGILVTRTLWDSSADGFLKAGDILTSLDDVPIADDGTIPFRGLERLHFSHLLTMHQIGEEAKLAVLREGKPETFTVTLKNRSPLVPPPLYDVKPSYLIFGGLVFTPLTYNFISTAGWQESVTSKLLYLYGNGEPTPERRQVVVLAQVLPHAVNRGYHDLQYLVLDRINGRTISDLKDLADAVEQTQEPFCIFEFNTQEDAVHVVLNTQEAREATKEIVEKFGLPSDRSEDLKKETEKSSE